MSSLMLASDDLRGLVEDIWSSLFTPEAFAEVLSPVLG